MGKYDTCMKAYLRNKERFADLFNGSCFQGKPVIRAEDLQDASEGYVISENRKSEIFRDVKMTLRSGMILQVLAVENQSYIDYGMPVRCMGYDAAEYSRQLKEQKQKHRLLMSRRKKISETVKAADCIQPDVADVESGTEVKITTDERLSGILKTDRLHPVYTLCLYSGTEPWDGPKKLSDLMTFDPANDSLKTLFEEYHLHLFCINEQRGFTAFHSDLKQLFQTMNCRKDKQKLAELVKDKAYTHLSEETWDAIAVMTDNAAMIRKKDLYKTKSNEKEEYNMCQALEELMTDSRNEGDLNRKRIVVENMLTKGFETEDICAIAGCDLTFVKKIQESMP